MKNFFPDFLAFPILKSYVCTLESADESRICTFEGAFLVIKCTLEGAFCGIICTLESANFIMEPTSAV